MKKFTALFLLALLLAFPLSAQAQEKKVVVAEAEGVIDPAVASYLEKAIDYAEKNAAPLLIKLDTPGGLDTSMRVIIKKMFASSVPVIVYVYPSGARAASAGCFITIAAHVAAMSPGTNIGAAHPVALGGEESTPSAVSEKAVNDAAAYIRSLAEARGRNADWAEKAVRESVSITEKEALKLGVIDYVAQDVNELLEKIDGKTVEVANEGRFTLDTDGAEQIPFEMNFIDRLLHAIANPNIAYMLLIIGFYGLIYEFSNPGVGFAGIGGAICLILGFYALHALSANYAALALIVLGLILFVAEAFTPTFGVLAGGGLISFIIGSLMLFERSAVFPGLSLTVVIPTALITLALVFIVVSAAVRAHRRKVETGKEGMIGLKGEARTNLNPEGQVFVRGEIWKAISEEGMIKKGEQIEVTGIEGLKLKVRKVK